MAKKQGKAWTKKQWSNYFTNIAYLANRDNEEITMMIESSKRIAQENKTPKSPKDKK